MKSPTHLEKCITCPRCGTKTMRKSIGKGPEYFDDKCHSYFTIRELVDIWGYDLGDFYGENTTELTNAEFTHMQNTLGRNLPLPEKYFPTTPIIIEYTTKRDALNELLPESTIQKLNLCSWEHNTGSDTFERMWVSKLDRDLAYEEVTAMQLGIPIIEGTGNSGIDFGYPISL